jgi:hypothetical protein
VTVNNVAPTFGPFGPFVIEEGSLLNTLADASDPGSDDLIFTWSWGDKTPTTTATYYNDGVGPDPYPSPFGNFPFSEIDSNQHRYNESGIYILNLTVEDDDGGATLFSTNVTVISVTPPPLFINVSQEGTDIILYWDSSRLVGVDHYLLYRSTDQRGFDFNEVWVNTSSHNESDEPCPTPLRTLWNDTGAASPGNDSNYAEQYYYVIRAVNILGGISGTSRTVGKWTKTFPKGISAFSLPLELLESRSIDDITWHMDAESIKYMNATVHAWENHNSGDGCINNTVVRLGEGYEVEFGDQTNYTFTGMPGAMIRFDDDAGFTGFDPNTDARNLTATADPFTGNIILNWTQPSGMGVNDRYYVLRCDARDGFWTGNYIRLANVSFDVLTYTDIGNATAGTQFYYMIVPVNGTGVKGASTYSTGVWSANISEQYDTVGMPLKIAQNETADWYCDNIPYTVGINYFDVISQRWCWHSTDIPSGAFDPKLVMTEGYQISTSDATKFVFIGS